MLDHRKRVCIVGFCKSSRNRVNYGDPELFIVGLNRGYIFMERADCWFDLHSPEIRGWQQRRPSKHMDFLRNFAGPVFLHAPDPDLPNALVYPLQEVADDLGQWVYRLAEDLTVKDTKAWPYLTSSIAMELALAIHEGATEISLVGVDLNTPSEYGQQKPGVEYLLGVAAGRGIKVILPDNCPLLDGPIYGRGFMKPEGETMSYPQLEERLQALVDERDRLREKLSKTAGAHQECEFLLGQMVPGLDHEALDQRKQKIAQQVQQLHGALHRIEGQLNETLHWIHITMEGQEPREAIQQLIDQASPTGLDAGGEAHEQYDVLDGEGDTVEADPEPEPALVAV